MEIKGNINFVAHVFANSGNGTFDGGTDLVTGAETTELGVADFTGDGRADLLRAESNPPSVSSASRISWICAMVCNNG